MKRLPSTVRAVALPFLAVLCLTLTVDAWVPVLAAAQQADEQQPPPADPAAERAAKRAEKERAKQARIEEYLRKREERRAKRAMEQQAAEKSRAAAAQASPQAAATEPAVEAAAPAAATAAAAPAAEKRGKRKRRAAAEGPEEVILPPNLARIHEELRETALGQDPTVIKYLDLIESGNASAHQLAAFGSFLADTGRIREGIEYYAVALDMERNDPVLWLNVGTLHRKLGEYNIAASAYSEALSLDINNAFAHYNLGAVYDEMGKYEPAVEEYKLALTLDPSLGDPVANPQAANNERLLAVKLMLYREQIGSLGLPLVDVPGGAPETQGTSPDDNH